MQKQRIDYLLNGYLDNKLSPLETEELQQLLLEDNTADRVTASFQELINTAAPDAQYQAAHWDAIAGNILSGEQNGGKYIPLAGNTRQGNNLFRRWMAVAAVLLCMGLGAYLWLQSGRKTRLESRQKPSFPGVTPGRDGAILTLADGSQVVLDSLGNKVVANQKGTEIVLKNGQLSYNASEDAKGQLVYNTITTPKGRQFHITLADGTGVWLNAASSLRFPAAFNGKERKVEITGEAYFEVAKDATKPFRVLMKEAADIEVLGTDFNVNAYDDEPNMKVTLLAGAVQVKKGTQAQLLQPGQQAKLATTGVEVVKEVDMERTVAWKNGTFSFGKEVSLDEMMRQIARWYNIEVIYEGGVPRRQFGGKIHRSADMEEVLEILEESGIHYRVNDKQLIILP